MARSPQETKQRQFRLAEETIALLDHISAHYHLGSRADAIRLAARLLCDRIGEPAPKNPSDVD